ncbi:MAG: type II toxin-antitoxin system VapC family toxin [Gemmatimonadetes bacterium]|nr:type II toxin-antitoxin system VapC family toxin [Gemmatimonadota bacterium]
MTKRFVVDASIAVAWVHPAQATPRTRALLQAVHDGAIIRAPALWPLETANALLVLARRGKLVEEERRAALSALAGLCAELDYEMVPLAFGKLSELARIHRLSVYDAAYLELASRAKLPLACKDGPLSQAAERYGLRLL